ncbi:hypothetical protein MKJ01_02480 [Chryseobacterium sp. SSA4.19]|uniref:hypothetical protein n=1 Tax=Chryseobacterium sp. SSA4.19 TaxID=2919915 RepID=UPI001F4D7DB9|nr:hypothetical protein [Chryseobacterium sp. SSA4.19]MCJ8152627.1 hypothetical protein [Chryseobacterium sp. SSA4.19]
MATKNTQNNPQTLFRFVSLRNPQLTETKKENLGFILRPSNLSSAFDSAVSPGDSALVKFQALERAAKSFSPKGYESELIIEQSILADALKIGRKISRKETLVTSEEASAKALNSNSNIQSKIAELWDNLIYQTVTEKNFYVKEALIHILKAIHYGYVCSLPVTTDTPKIKAKALTARVVLPMKFFGDGYEGTVLSGPGLSIGSTLNGDSSQTEQRTANTTDLPLSIQNQLTAEGNKISELSKLNFEKESLEKLKSELQNLQTVYVKLKNKAYETANLEYKERYKKEIDAYNVQLERIKSQITTQMTEAEIDKLYESLQPLNIPLFQLTYKNELNFEDLKDGLSLDSLKLFINLFTKRAGNAPTGTTYDDNYTAVLSERKLQLGSYIVEMNKFYDTYAEVFEKLDQQLSATVQLLLQKSPLEEQKYLNLGNILVPVSNSQSNLSQAVSRTYYFKASYNTGIAQTSSSLIFYYQAESNSYGLGSAKISASTDLGLFEEAYSNINIVDNKITFPPVLVNRFGKVIRSLKIQIFFNNGKQATLEYTNIIIDQPYTGILYTEEIKTDGSGNTTPQPGVFFPKHFGVKRLGIADYLKVVQTTHAYVPGDVTHIENVMAKEFKQKSTRKLRRSEIQNTTSKSTERETLSDTTSTNRNDMQSEVANIIQQNTNAEAHFNYGGGSYQVGGSFASHNAKENSIRQAVAKSQEITEKATERLLTKVAEERIEKIIEEFEENNAHGFDNRNGDKHVIGVYRWVDKKMKNQIYNYGKRTMFEFMIPEPAKLHRLATAASVTETLTAPVDPRTAPRPRTMADPKSASLDQIQYWAGIYGVKLTELLETTKSFTTGLQWIKLNGDGGYKHLNIDIPANYQASHVKMWYGFERNRKGGSTLYTSNFAGGMVPFNNTSASIDNVTEFSPQNVTGTYDFVYQGSNIDSVNFNFEVTCKLSDAYMNAWKQENFDTIIKAYQEAYTAFQEKKKELEAAAKELEKENQEKVSVFYRDMERVILKHNCIAFLLQDYSALGKNLTNNAKAMQDFSIILDENMDQYTALAKFMEQAFEWTIMQYTFYPYYWANRNEWQNMYLSNSADPLFRNFLQAGMARVIVTVNPGFEDAVQFFLTTGRIWNGGEVPVIGDPMYMSIVDEMREPVGLKQGKAWISTVPTALNILQKDSAGLVTATALPFTQENPDEFEVPADVVTETEFSIVADAQLNSGKDRFIDNIELNEGFLQLTTDDSPKKVVAQLPLSDLKKSLQ